MSIIQRISGFFQKDQVYFLPIWGPLFLLPTLALATKNDIPFDFLLLSVAGFYLSARFQMRGLVYSLILLGIGAAIKHTVAVDHLWQLGLEGSLATAFFITSLSFEQSALFTQSLKDQIETRGATLQNLEEEFAKNSELLQSQQILSQEKLSQVQKELEELQTEHSSILILNEVLRKSNASAVTENEALSQSISGAQQQIVLLRHEYGEVQKEVAQLRDENGLVRKNEELLKELNATRLQREQAHILNENLIRLQQKEMEKARHVEAELVAAKEQTGLQRTEIKMLSSHIEKLSAEIDRSRTLALQHNEVTMQRNFLSERLQAYELEINQLKTRNNDPQLVKELQVARATIEDLQTAKGAADQELVVASGKIIELQQSITDSVPHLEFEKTLELLAALEREKNELKSAVQEKEVAHSGLAEKLDLLMTEREKEKETFKEELQRHIKTSSARIEELEAQTEVLNALQSVKEEKENLEKQLQVLNAENGQLRLLSTEYKKLLKTVSQLETEKKAIEEQLQSAQPDTHTLEQVEYYQEKAKELSALEPLYKQLKKQFEEKNGVLHQVRSELFKVDTELQAMKIEKEQASLQQNLLPEEIRKELEALDQTLEQLEEENRLLEELVSQFNEVKFEKKK